MQRLFSSCLSVRRSVGLSVCLSVGRSVGPTLLSCPSIRRSVGWSLQGFYSIPLNRRLGDWGIGGFGDWGIGGLGDWGIRGLGDRGIEITGNLYGDMGIPIGSGITRFPGLVFIALRLLSQFLIFCSDKGGGGLDMFSSL